MKKPVIKKVKIPPPTPKENQEVESSGDDEFDKAIDKLLGNPK